MADRRSKITQIMPNVATHRRSTIGIPKRNPHEVTSFGIRLITQIFTSKNNRCNLFLNRRNPILKLTSIILLELFLFSDFSLPLSQLNLTPPNAYALAPPLATGEQGKDKAERMTKTAKPKAEAITTTSTQKLLSSDNPTRILENGVELYEVPIDLKSDKKALVCVDPDTVRLMRSLPAGTKLTFFGSQALEMVRGEGSYIAKEGRLQSGGDIDIYVADDRGLGSELGERVKKNYADIASPSLKNGFFNRAIYQTLVGMYSISRLNVTFTTLGAGEVRVSLGDSETLVSDYEDLTSGIVRYTGDPNDISPSSAIQGLIYCARYGMHLEEKTSQLIRKALSDKELRNGFGAEERLNKLFLKAKDPGYALELISQLGLMQGHFFNQICYSFTLTKKVKEAILSDKLSSRAMREFLVKIKLMDEISFTELTGEKEVMVKVSAAVLNDEGVKKGDEFAITQWLFISDSLFISDVLSFVIKEAIRYARKSSSASEQKPLFGLGVPAAVRNVVDEVALFNPEYNTLRETIGSIPLSKSQPKLKAISLEAIFYEGSDIPIFDLMSAVNVARILGNKIILFSSNPELSSEDIKRRLKNANLPDNLFHYIVPSAQLDAYLKDKKKDISLLLSDSEQDIAIIERLGIYKTAYTVLKKPT